MNTTKSTIAKFTAGILTSALLLGAGVTGASAESPIDESGEASQIERMERMEKRLDRKVSKLTEKLGLSEGQAVKVRSILESSRTEIMDAKQRANGDRKAARAEIKQIRENTRAELGRVLTGQQAAALDELRAERAERKKARKGKKGRRGGKARFARLAKKLDLDETQRAQFKQIHQDARAEKKAIIDAAGGDRGAAKPELKVLKQETRAKIDAILTAEQKAEFDALRAERKSRKGKRGKRGGDSSGR